MKHHTFYIQASGQSKLFAQIWQPAQNPKGVICLVHGIGEHGSRYQAWAARFVEANFAVVGFDQRGHGLSSGKRGVIHSYRDLMLDIDLVLVDIAVRFTDIPVFFYGHSMGGGEVLNHLLTQKSRYAAVIATSPWIITQAAPPKFVMPFIRFLNWMLPSLRLKSKFDSSLLSHDKLVVQDYDDDTLVHHMVSFALFTGAYDAGYKILQHTDQLKKPLLLLHGAADSITNPLASKIFAENHSEKCTFKLWQGAYHELHNELEKNQVFNFIITWINNILEQNQ